jgi:thiol-disulfide isomerase/thioredoxin
MRLTYLIIILILVATASFAQTPTKVYRTKEGTLYTSVQMDSLRKAGHPTGEISLTTVGDTSFIDVEVYPKQSPLGSSFVQKYKGKKLPFFQLKTLDGKKVDSESLKGKMVMINFWSTTCGPCILEMPQLNQLKEKHMDVVFLAPAPENAASIKKLLTKHQFNFIILPDAKQLFEEWGIDGYPKNFFVDQNGIIQEVIEGTPILKERDEKGQLQVAVMQTYSPILSGLKKEK